MRVRHVVPALLAITVASGCRALDMGSLGRAPEPLTPRATAQVSDIIERHNRNAELVTSLQATPSVSMKSERLRAPARGHMALERPRNFRMDLEAGISRPVADVGSNQEEIWVWVAGDRDKDAIYVCKYDGDGEVPAGLPFQPDWIVEGLGLRVIPAEEERQITVGRVRDDPTAMALVHHRENARGDRTQKITVVDKATGAIKSHIFFAPDGKTRIAWVEVQHTTEVPPESADQAETIFLPDRIKLTTALPGQQPVEMQVSLSDFKVNPGFAQERRDVLFAVPDKPNAKIVDITDQLRREQGTATVRETRPIPASNTGVRIGEPVPLDDATTTREDDEPAPLTSDLGEFGGGMDELIGGNYPRPSVDDERIAVESQRVRMARPVYRP